MQSTGTGQAGNRRGMPRDIAAGLFMLAVAAVALWGTSGLPMSDGGGIGPGFMPKGVAMLIAGFGVLLLAIGLAGDRAPIERLSLRAPIFVLGSIIVFAATIRTLGLAFAGPLAVTIAALADKQSRVVEVLLFAIATTVFCILLFKYILRLPVPLAPILIGY